MNGITLKRQNGCLYAYFSAMNNPCELIFDSDEHASMALLAEQIAQLAWQLECKYSRFKPVSLCSRINQSQGRPIAIDQQTFELLNFAEQCYQLSDGLFDITGGVLNRAWHFDSDELPTPRTIESLLQYVGWQKVQFTQHSIILPQGMALDFGGIVKEYAVDKAIELLRHNAPGLAVLVNFGGDLAVSAAKSDNRAWTVGINDNDHKPLQLLKGALATSGDTQRFIERNGVRYGHILNPKTGWPALGGPSTVTVAAPTCLMAGMLSTMAMLHGEDAEAFLQAQGVEYWCS